MARLYIVCPPFVQGGIEQTLANHIIDLADDMGIDHKTFGYHFHPEIKEGTGFYNNSTWMKHCLNSVTDLVSTISKEKPEEATILFTDFWYPGIDTVRTHLKLLGLSYPIVAWLHGASFVDGDLMSDYPYPEMERSWLASIDTLWAASKFFSRDVPTEYKSKVRITGSPFDPTPYLKMPKIPYSERSIDIILPCRFAKDKINLKVLWQVATEFKDKRIVITSKRPDDVMLPSNVEFIFDREEADHLARLSQAKVVFSMAMQEGWGYGIMKAVTLGCSPVLPNQAVYPELYPEKALYKPWDVIGMLRSRLEEPIDLSSQVKRFTMFPAMKDDPAFSSLFGSGYR